jgi:alkylhydroperoxidase/carboxymuconolactone decarboxylase family protein YurZ
MVLSKRETELQQKFLDLRGAWSPEWEALLKLNPDYFEAYVKLQAVSQSKKHLSAKVQEFIYIAVAASPTHIHIPGIKAHIQSALSLGATAAEITEVIGLTTLLGIHTVTLGAPILLELMKEEEIENTTAAPESERQRIKEAFIRQRGFWTDTWNPILELDPYFFEAYVDFSSLPSKTGVLDPKDRELITCAFDAATTHLYARGTRIHMQNALRLGATPGEVMEMLEITMLMGVHGVVVAAPLLLEQLGLEEKGKITNGGSVSQTVESSKESEKKLTVDEQIPITNGDGVGLDSVESFRQLGLNESDVKNTFLSNVVERREVNGDINGGAVKLPEIPSIVS